MAPENLILGSFVKFKRAMQLPNVGSLDCRQHHYVLLMCHYPRILISLISLHLICHNFPFLNISQMYHFYEAQVLTLEESCLLCSHLPDSCMEVHVKGGR